MNKKPTSKFPSRETYLRNSNKKKKPIDEQSMISMLAPDT